MYLLIKYIKSVLWRVVKRLSLYTGRTVPKVNENCYLVSCSAVKPSDHRCFKWEVRSTQAGITDICWKILKDVG